ncbi:SDR family NAD(P)-dependent oxidoreductase [Aminobacter aganoensis]|uniref:NAD(P)-dependent dehydrogenase (Short-subunit alcohol dehydrogenase family) n=1 Tax=Aminobacter aganoensis TaxID=83264 RepID=A0A7X0FCJ2_9HYPH|nr:SDR family oxidoreductase [Aminobacter aganoensis]MBB6357242.1 NAD(P)-dependent dehydrogenase (short-subunit alcohol dehydrogenase family) [Aminobacter aganoensis]
MNKAFDLAGRAALVTGGGRGIGRACALSLAAAGADVAVIDLDSTIGEELAAEIRKLGRRSSFFPCDVASPDQVDAAIDGVANLFGRLDVAVNNAGVWRRGADETQAPADWDAVVSVNLTGVWLCAMAEMKLMRKNRPAEGKIINIASVGSFIYAGNGAYDASKAGVVQLSRSLAAQWGRYNINVNCISPGYVGNVFGRSRSEEERQRLREITPLGYVQRTADLCGPVVFLASSASDYVTGHNLVVDGGHSLSTWLRPLERDLPPRVDPAGELDDIPVVAGY